MGHGRFPFISHKQQVKDVKQALVGAVGAGQELSQPCWDTLWGNKWSQSYRWLGGFCHASCRLHCSRRLWRACHSDSHCHACSRHHRSCSCKLLRVLVIKAGNGMRVRVSHSQLRAHLAWAARASCLQPAPERPRTCLGTQPEPWPPPVLEPAGFRA